MIGVYYWEEKPVAQALLPVHKFASTKSTAANGSVATNPAPTPPTVPAADDAGSASQC
jgi:hypothetical protein